MTDTLQARAIATAVLGRDPGPMTVAESISHQVHVAADIVVKVIGAGDHPRLSREIALAPDLPAGITAALLDSGVHVVDGRQVRYACYARVPGAAPGMGLPGADRKTACALAKQSVQRLGALHAWSPSTRAAQILREPLDHGGFVTREALLAEIDGLQVPAALLKGLRVIAVNAPERARVNVPVHADCHWGNWLASNGTLTALLDFEWARFGEPMDDWFFVIADSGPHAPAVLDVITAETAIPPDVLRAECEVREANYLASDIRLAHANPRTHARLLAQRMTRLTELITERPWWRPAPCRACGSAGRGAARPR
ncbi:phosphotransferase [Actinoplanes sp. NBC_00393]|uniref:phosphotransferase n=1 Tax=Actinoplanes sp. NBC_00393 TaxID=2975953 RepID=UPI002E1F9FEA